MADGIVPEIATQFAKIPQVSFVVGKGKRNVEHVNDLLL